MSIPSFPSWRPIHGGDKGVFDRFCRSHAPYAEATLATLLVWNRPEACAISELNGNVLVRHRTCEDRDVLSVLGRHRPVDTSVDLLRRGCGPVELVPDYSVAGVDRDAWDRASLRLVADRDNDDYVLDTLRLSTLAGKELKGRRHNRNGFERSNNPTARALDLSSSTDVRSIVARAEAWSREVAVGGSDPLEDELEGILRLLDGVAAGAVEGIEAFGVDVSGELVAFSIVEVHGTDTVSGVAFKATRALSGSAEFLRSTSASSLSERGFRRINVQQDLGHAGLRAMKQSYRPVAMLRKWRIEPKDGSTC